MIRKGEWWWSASGGHGWCLDIRIQQVVEKIVSCVVETAKKWQVDGPQKVWAFWAVIWPFTQKLKRVIKKKIDLVSVVCRKRLIWVFLSCNMTLLLMTRRHLSTLFTFFPWNKWIFRYKVTIWDSTSALITFWLMCNCFYSPLWKWYKLAQEALL